MEQVSLTAVYFSPDSYNLVVVAYLLGIGLLVWLHLY